MRNDQAYYAARAVEERRLAMASENPNARRAHLEMAAQYAIAAGADAMPADEDPGQREQRTA
jgi:hypothetical protein